MTPKEQYEEWLNDPQAQKEYLQWKVKEELKELKESEDDIHGRSSSTEL